MLDAMIDTKGARNLKLQTILATTICLLFVHTLTLVIQYNLELP
jgi:hypothetical protein